MCFPLSLRPLGPHRPRPCLLFVSPQVRLLPAILLLHQLLLFSHLGCEVYMIVSELPSPDDLPVPPPDRPPSLVVPSPKKPALFGLGQVWAPDRQTRKLAIERQNWTGILSWILIYFMLWSTGARTSEWHSTTPSRGRAGQSL